MSTMSRCAVHVLCCRSCDCGKCSLKTNKCRKCAAADAAAIAIKLSALNISPGSANEVGCPVLQVELGAGNWELGAGNWKLGRRADVAAAFSPNLIANFMYMPCRWATPTRQLYKHCGHGQLSFFFVGCCCLVRVSRMAAVNHEIYLATCARVQKFRKKPAK